MTTNITVKMGVSSNDAPADFKEGRLSFNITKKVIYLDWKGQRYVFGEQPQWNNHEEEDDGEDDQSSDDSEDDKTDYRPEPEEKGQQDIPT